MGKSREAKPVWSSTLDRQKLKLRSRKTKKEKSEGVLIKECLYSRRSKLVVLSRREVEEVNASFY